MTDYLVSEEELKKYTRKYYTDDYKEKADNDTSDFLKSKQPVELLAEGEVVKSETMFAEAVIKDGNNFYAISSFLDRFDGNNIKLYIVKE